MNAIIQPSVIQGIEGWSTDDLTTFIASCGKNISAAIAATNSKNPDEQLAALFDLKDSRADLLAGLNERARRTSKPAAAFVVVDWYPTDQPFDQDDTI